PFEDQFHTPPDRACRARSASARRADGGGGAKRGGLALANVISMKLLLEAGVHFGHQTRRWDPRMKRFIFTERNGIHIIDLQQTVSKLNDAYSYVRDLAKEGGSILFVGTKKQAQEAVEAEAKRAEQYFVNQ